MAVPETLATHPVGSARAGYPGRACSDGSGGTALAENDGDRAEFVRWARSSASRLGGVEFDLDASDLDPVTAVVGAARIVGLGETWHPVHEFLAINYRVARFLIEQMGFTAILLEASLSSARYLDDFVNGGSRDIAELALSAVWSTKETASFLRWLRGYNAALAPAQRVHVFGLDAHILIMDDSRAPGTAAEEVIAYLGRVDPEFSLPHLDSVRAIFAGFTPAGNPATASFAYFGTLDPGVSDTMRIAFTHAVARLAEKRSEYRHRSSAASYEWAMHRAVVVLQAQQMYDALSQDLVHGLAVRALAMAENAQWALDRAGADARAVILGTSTHLAKAGWTYAGRDTPIPSIGMRLADWHGPDYVALTTTFGTGEFTPPNPITGTTTIPAGQPDCLDLALDQVGAPYLLVDLHGRVGPHPPAGWLSHPHPLRPMQNVSAPTAYRLPDAFDGALHVSEIHTAAPITDG
jgi:erythromycin esterase